MDSWTPEQIPDQSGRLAVVTGGNSGLGLVTVLELARHGARVVLAARNPEKGEAAARRIRSLAPEAKVEPLRLDLASLASVRAFAAQLGDTEEKIDLLINNAGVMQTPKQSTEDGFEMQLGTNHLGHFALTGLVLDLLERGTQSRVVTVSSIEHKPGRINFDDLNMDRRYGPRRAYQQSKLANVLFALELERRLRAGRATTISVLAHPGVAATNLVSTGPTGIRAAVMSLAKYVSQSAARGAQPQLYAATAPGVAGGQFFGPSGFMESRGHVAEVRAARRAEDPETARRLWDISEKLTGVAYPLPDAAA